MSKNLYEELGIDRFADQHEIKRAFRKLLVEKHPDKHLDDPNAAGLFMKVTEAYEILRDPIKKRIYDCELNNVDLGSTTSETLNPISHSWGFKITNASVGTFLWEAFDQHINTADYFDERNDLFLYRKFGNTSNL